MVMVRTFCIMATAALKAAAVKIVSKMPLQWGYATQASTCSRLIDGPDTMQA